MNTLIEKYSKQYRRVAMASDAKSEYASDILFYGIKKWLDYDIPLTLKLSRSEPLCKLHVLDQWNYMIPNYEAVPFRTIVNNWFPNIRPDDGYIFRGMHWNSSDGAFRGVPSRLVYEEELVLGIIDNELTIIKDRYNSVTFTKMDLTPFLRSSKIKTLIKNING